MEHRYANLNHFYFGRVARYFTDDEMNEISLKVPVYDFSTDCNLTGRRIICNNI